MTKVSPRYLRGPEPGTPQPEELPVLEAGPPAGWIRIATKWTFLRENKEDRKDQGKRKRI